MMASSGACAACKAIEPTQGRIQVTSSPFIVSGQWWMSFFPGAALILMTTGFILVGDGLSARTER